MKDVSIYVRGICNSELTERPGRYIVILRYKSIKKVFRGAVLKTTSNRMIITGLIEGIGALKESCNIRAYIQCNIGVGKVLKGKISGINRDILKALDEVIKKGNHEIEFIVSPEKQKELDTLIKQEAEQRDGEK